MSELSGLSSYIHDDPTVPTIDQIVTLGQDFSVLLLRTCIGNRGYTIPQTIQFIDNLKEYQEYLDDESDDGPDAVTYDNLEQMIGNSLLDDVRSPSRCSDCRQYNASCGICGGWDKYMSMNKINGRKIIACDQTSSCVETIQFLIKACGGAQLYEDKPCYNGWCEGFCGYNNLSYW